MSNGTSRATSRSLPVSLTSNRSFAVTSVSLSRRPRRSNITSRACKPPKCLTTRRCKRWKSNRPPTNLGRPQKPILSPFTKARRSSMPNFFDSGSSSSNNPPHVLPHITSALSTANHHSLLEYTNSLEGALENASEHAAAITLDNTTLLQKLDAQQKATLEQQAKFMALLAQTDRVPLTPPTAPRNPCNRTNAVTPTEGRRNPRFCNSCKKDNVYHGDDECFALDKNKDKRPSWYRPKK
eukprot:CCRYP_013456-RA/>CCRYP_013456-RA protein AED:0.81 eAED:0.46 QI:0/0/0/0.5/0/0.5/2/0/238